MNKKECNEIKKLFTPANCAISRICGCYVDAEKNKKTGVLGKLKWVLCGFCILFTLLQ